MESTFLLREFYSLQAFVLRSSASSTFCVHRFQFFGSGADRGKPIVLYLAVMAGKFSVDAQLGR
jgi:hypothetical protein